MDSGEPRYCRRLNYLGLVPVTRGYKPRKSVRPYVQLPLPSQYILRPGQRQHLRHTGYSGDIFQAMPPKKVKQGIDIRCVVQRKAPKPVVRSYSAIPADARIPITPARSSTHCDQESQVSDYVTYANAIPGGPPLVMDRASATAGGVSADRTHGKLYVSACCRPGACRPVPDQTGK